MLMTIYINYSYIYNIKLKHFIQIILSIIIKFISNVYIYVTNMIAKKHISLILLHKSGMQPF